MAEPLSRDVPFEPGQTALLFIDVQNFGAARNGGAYADIPEAEFEDRLGYYFERLEKVAVPNMRHLQRARRGAGIEVMHTVGTPRVSTRSPRSTTRSSSPRPRPASSSPPTSTTCSGTWACAITSCAGC